MTDADAKTRSFLEAARAGGITDGGAEWAAKALYPPATLPCSAIPDDTQFAALLPEYRVEQVVTKWGSVGAGNWDCLILTHSGDATFATVVVAPPGADFSSPSVWTSTAVRHVNIPNRAGSTITAHTLSPTLDPWTDVEVLTDPSNPRALRITHSSMTVYMTASDLENGGAVTSGQVPPLALEAGMAYIDSSDVAGVAHCMRVQIPLSENEIALNCPRYYAGPARDGVYVPKRLAVGAGFAEPYVNENDLVSLRVENLGAGAFYLRDHYQMSEVTWYTNGNVTLPPTGFTPVLQSVSTRDSVGVTIFRGLHPNASLMLKGYLGLQMIPKNASDALGYLRPPGVYDPRATEFYESYSRTMRDGYRASDNFLGAIFNAAKGFIPKLLSFLAPAAKTAARAAVPALAASAVRALDPPPKPPTARRRASSVASRVSSRARSYSSRGSRGPRQRVRKVAFPKRR